MINSTPAGPIHAIVDTSVLVPPSLRADLQRAALERGFIAIWSPWIIGELNRVLVWRWIKDRTGGDISDANERAASQAASKMMSLLVSAFEVVNPRPPYPQAWEHLADADDYPIWAAAVEAKAQYVISDNTSDYPPLQPDGRYAYQGIEYISGRNFLKMLLPE
jgi:predicted nucleic acid-binding protein